MALLSYSFTLHIWSCTTELEFYLACPSNCVHYHIEQPHSCTRTKAVG